MQSIEICMPKYPRANEKKRIPVDTGLYNFVTHKGNKTYKRARRNIDFTFAQDIYERQCCTHY